MATRSSTIESMVASRSSLTDSQLMSLRCALDRRVWEAVIPCNTCGGTDSSQLPLQPVHELIDVVRC